MTHTAILLKLLFFFSAASLAFEIFLMRYFSAYLWDTLGSMVIAMAMLGFGAAAPLISSIRSHRRLSAIRVSGLIFSIFTLSSVLTLRLIPFNPYLLPVSLIWWVPLCAMYVMLFIPFLSIATFTGLVFRELPRITGVVYAHNLLGAGLGAAIIYVLTRFVLPETLFWAVIFLVLCGYYYLLGLLSHKHIQVFWGVIPLSLIILIFIFGFGTSYDQYKDISQLKTFPEATSTYSTPTPLGTLEVVEAPAFHAFPSLLLGSTPEITRQHAIFLDGNFLTFLTDTQNPSSIQTSLSLVTSLKPEGRMLILGAGGGWEIIQAQQKRYQNIIAVESIESIHSLLTTRYHKAIGQTLLREPVKWHATSIRAYLTTVHPPSDLIVLTQHTLHHPSKNMIHTAQTYALALSQLASDGIFMIDTPLFHPPREGLRVISTLLDALTHAQLDAGHVLAFRDQKHMVLLIKRSPWTPQERQTWVTVFFQNNMDVVYYESVSPHDLNRIHKLARPYYFLAINAYFQKHPHLISSLTPFDVRATTDSRPYFDRFVRWSKLKDLFQTYGKQSLAYIGLTDMMRAALLLQLILGGALLILVPALWITRKYLLKNISTLSGWRQLLYFGCLGFGYIAIEMMLIDSLSTWIFGDFISAAACVISSLLIFSGIGAYISDKGLKKIPSHLHIPLACISTALLTLLTWFVFSQLSPSLAAHSPLTQLCLSALLLAPLGCVMGMPFPLAFKKLLTSHEHLWPWAYGVNGYLSVLGAPLSIFIAEAYGFQTTFFHLATLYLIAALLWPLKRAVYTVLS